MQNMQDEDQFPEGIAPRGDRYQVNDLDWKYEKKYLSDHFAAAACKAMRFVADKFFRKRYGHRAVILETVAAVPGMVGAAHNHLRSLRRAKPDGGWIRTLMDEAENERMHLMTFLEIAKPTILDRALIIGTQAAFLTFFSLAYVFNKRTAHRFVGMIEEEAIHSYTEYLKEIDNGNIENVDAPQIAKDYWNLPEDAKLRDVVVAVRADEAEHRDVNHLYADRIEAGQAKVKAAKEEKKEARRRKKQGIPGPGERTQVSYTM